MSEKIYQAIPAIMAEIDAVGKNKKNAQQGFMYRGIDDVMNAINPALTKYKVFIVPEILEQNREERKTAKGGTLLYSICKMKFKFFAEDGSFVEAVTIGEGMDSGDKATNKAMAIAFKYACFQVFCIPTEEMKDPDAVTPPNTTKHDDTAAHQQMVNNANASIIDEVKVKVLKEKIEKKGLSEHSILEHYKIKNIEEMNFEMWNDCRKLLDKYKDVA